MTAKLKSARSVYAEKVAIRKDMLAEHRDRAWPINLEPNPAGRFALHQALQEESAAPKEYMGVLRMFNELMREGILPEEVPRLFLVNGEMGTISHDARCQNYGHKPHISPGRPKPRDLGSRKYLASTLSERF